MNLRQNCCMSVEEQTWEALNSAVLELLNHIDPYGLEPRSPDGAPTDEYSPEAGPMATHLLERGRVSGAEIDAIWVHWFDETLSRTID